MKKRLNRFAVFLALAAVWFGPIAAAQASGCRVVASAVPYVAPSYQATNYATNFAAVTYNFVPVLSLYAPAPLFTVGQPYGAYPAAPAAATSPPAATATATVNTQAHCPEVKELKERLAAMEAKLNAALEPIKPQAAPAPQAKAAPVPQEAPPQPAPQAKAAAEPSLPGVLSVMQGKCARCHEAKVSASKGKGLTLLLGEALVDVDAETSLAVVRDCYDGSMPKGGQPLSDQEVQVLVKHYTGKALAKR